MSTALAAGLAAAATVVLALAGPPAAPAAAPLAAPVAGTVAATTAGPATDRYLTIVAGRSFWEATAPDCSSYGDSVTVDLLEVAKALAARARPLAAYGLIQGAFTGSGSTRLCGNSGSVWAATYATWPDLATLRDSYGWTFGSNGRDLNYMTAPGRTLAQQWTTSCGALSDLRQHGQLNGSALFAYPGGGDAEDLDDTVQRDVVSKCYSFSRVYTDNPPFQRNQYADEGSRTKNPLGWLWTHNIYGGGCHLSSDPCAQRPILLNRSYDSPQDLAAFVQSGPGEWAVLQFHAFVTGARLSGAGNHWDCRSSDWRAHWTDRPELYCWGDFLTVLNAIPAGVKVVQPSVVAAAWHRTMPAPRITSVSPASGTTGAKVTIAGANFRAVGSPNDSYVSGNGFRVLFGTKAATVTSVSATTVTVKAPAPAAPGTIDVTLIDADGQRTTASNAFTYR